jgi:hypothetical protein
VWCGCGWDEVERHGAQYCSAVLVGGLRGRDDRYAQADGVSACSSKRKLMEELKFPHVPMLDTVRTRQPTARLLIYE